MQLKRIFHVEISPNAPAQRNVVVFCHVVHAFDRSDAITQATARGIAPNASVSNVYAVN